MILRNPINQPHQVSRLRQKGQTLAAGLLQDIRTPKGRESESESW